MIPASIAKSISDEVNKHPQHDALVASLSSQIELVIKAAAEKGKYEALITLDKSYKEIGMSQVVVEEVIAKLSALGYRTSFKVEPYKGTTRIYNLKMEWN